MSTQRRSGPGAEEPARPAAAPEEPVDFDPLQVVREAREAPRTVQRARSSLRDSLRVVLLADRRRALLNAALQIGATLVVLLQLLVAKLVLDALLEAGGRGDVDAATAALLVLLAVATSTSQALTQLQTQQTRLLGDAVTRRTWQELLGVTTRVPLATFEDPAFHDRLQRVKTFALIRPLEVTNALAALAGGLLTAGGLLAVLVAIEPLLVPVLAVVAAPLLLLGRRDSKAEFRFAVAESPDFRRRYYLSDLLSDQERAKEVRAYGLGPALLARYLGLYDAHTGRLERHVRGQTRRALLGTLLTTVALALALLLLALFLRSGRIGVSDAAVAVLALRLLAGRLQAVVGALGKLFESGLFLEDLAAFLQLAPDGPDGSGPLPTGTQASVALRGVGFTYPGSTAPALADVDLELLPGQVVALVGENGSGKTTLAKVLAGLYAPTAGEVRWDVDGEAVSADRVREQVTVLFQDFARFELSAGDNVALGRPGEPYDQARVERAAEVAGVRALVEGLPRGWDTVLSKAFPGGRDLSLGQWQRVALARAFYRDAPVVVLDEPTASLDPRAEHELFQDLRTLLQGRSVLLVSHRFSNVRMADRIHVLDGGRITQSGTHDELMAQGGAYADLYRLQATAYGLLD